MSHRLTRSRSDAILGGVCGGLGEFFDVDSNVVRLLFVLFAALTVLGILIYFALWLLLPESDARRADLADRVQDAAEQIADRAMTVGHRLRDAARPAERSPAFLLGAVLVLVGTGFLLRNLGIAWMRWLAFGTLWPVLPLVIGLAFLWRWMRGGR
jgi:phage shock protein C